MKDFQAKKDASNPPKRTFSISKKHEISSILCLFVGYFLPSLIRIIIKHYYVLGDCKSEVAREKESQVAIRKKITEESKTTGINTP